MFLVAKPRMLQILIFILIWSDSDLPLKKMKAFFFRIIAKGHEKFRTKFLFLLVRKKEFDEFTTEVSKNLKKY